MKEEGEEEVSDGEYNNRRAPALLFVTGQADAFAKEAC